MDADGGNTERRFAYTDSELKALREEVEARVGHQLDIFSDDTEAKEEQSVLRSVEIYSAETLAKLASNLDKRGFSITQYERMEEPLGEFSVGGKDRKPLYSLPELLDAVRQLGRQGLTIQRYKGLGEMNPDQLYETTMNKATRKLLKVVVENAAMANEMFTILMGDEVEPRRKFIEENALNVKNLDI